MDVALEQRLIRPTDIRYDQFGNSWTHLAIEGTEICNVPLSTRFIKPTDFKQQDRERFFELLRNVQSHTITPQDNLAQGTHYAACVSQGRAGTFIPEVLLLGDIAYVEDKPMVSGNVLVSFHDYDEKFKPKYIGFDIGKTQQTVVVRRGEDRIIGASLSDEQYQAILNTLEVTPIENTIPHPGTREFVRRGAEYQALSKSYQAAGLKEIAGAMFKSEGEAAAGTTLVAVHPYYLEYHDTFGERDTQTSQERTALINKYDELFGQHQGPLVVVEEEKRVLSTLERMRRIGRKGDTYFVITYNSSAFPYTENMEFIGLLRQLGVEGTKFVGGHDAGDKPYKSTDLSGETITFSGCLRGLAHRIEKRGFPAVETIPGYTYS